MLLPLICIAQRCIPDHLVIFRTWACVKKSIYFTAMFVLTECIITMAIVRNCSRKGFYFSLVRFWKIAMMLNASCYAIFFLFAKPERWKISHKVCQNLLSTSWWEAQKERKMFLFSFLADWCHSSFWILLIFSTIRVCLSHDLCLLAWGGWRAL
jgi:hypothetical protein